MKISEKHIKEFFIYLIIILCQLKFSFIFEVNGISPDFILIFLILNSFLSESPIQGTIKGFFSGLLIDMLIGSVTGVSSLVYSAAGFYSGLIGRSREKFSKTSIFTLSLGVNIFVSFVYYFVVLFNAGFLDRITDVILPQIVYNMVLMEVIILILPLSKKKQYI